MKISLNWLADYVELPESVEELASRLTLAGLEVEGIERLGADLDAVVVAEVLERAPHPDAEKLSVVQVDAGAHGRLSIVCGAKNFQVGDKVPLAMVGATLPSGVKIEKAKLRGVESSGMLCSAKELGLDEDSSGLLILESAAPVGRPVADALGLRDTVFEINVTPNRADCLSHIGVARDVAALYGRAVKLPPVSGPSVGRDGGPIPIAIEAPDKCPRYAARVIEGVTIAPSPRWLRNRLHAVGVRALSNAVDVTNYVLLECGQPLHAFDLAKLEGPRIVVRAAREGERMMTLDGKDRALSRDDLMIRDAAGPVAIAGVMGGATTEVSETTRSILLESAAFAPVSVRRTASRHALRSEASHRFERGIDPAMVAFAQDRACHLLAELCGATLVKGRFEAGAEPPPRRSFSFSPSAVGALLGTPVPEAEVHQRLESLGFVFNGGEVTPPSWRQDVEGEVDCVEEVARLRGFESIPVAMPRGANELRPPSPRSLALLRTRAAMAACGFDEVVNYSFVKKQDLEALFPDRPPLLLQNPISADQGALCTTRLAGLLGDMRRNLNRQIETTRLYEIGAVYAPLASPHERRASDERETLAAVMFGPAVAKGWNQETRHADWYDLKGAVEALVTSLKLAEVAFAPTSLPLLHPRSAAELRIGGRPAGFLGELHPTVARALDLPRGILLFELELDFLLDRAALVPRFRSVPRFPAVSRDIALVVDATIPSDRVEAAIRRAGGPLLESVRLFDLYRGPGIPEGKRSLAFSFTLRHPERTLTDAEATRLHGEILARVSADFGAELRF